MNFLTLQTKMIIITPALPDGSTCPLILRGRLYGKCDTTPLLR